MVREVGATRERILDGALALFGTRGYAATTVRDIAAAVGIKAASLYNHFAGKQEIFEALMRREIAYAEEAVRASGSIARPGDDPHFYIRLGADELADLVWGSYAPFFTDERIRLVRRMLAGARYTDEACAALYRAIFFERSVQLEAAIFACFVDGGVFAPCDVELAAVQFHGPMLVLVDLEAPADEAEAFCRRHLAAFNASHQREE